MRHDDCKKLISLMLDNEATSEEKLAASEHLKTCPSCRAYANEITQLSFLLKSWQDENPSPDLEQQFQNKFDARRQREGTSMKRKQYFETALTAGVVIVLIAGLHLFTSRGITGRVANLARSVSAPIERTKTVQKVMTSGAEIVKSTQSVVSRATTLAKAKQATDDISAHQYQVYSLGSKGIVGEMPKGLDVYRESSDFQSYAPRSSQMIYDSSFGLESGLAGSSMRGAPEAMIGYPQIAHWPGSPGFDREGYNRIYDNKFLDVSQNPLSTFSIDVDTASYSNIRRFLNNNQMPPEDAVRIEEMINYFSYDYPQPKAGDPFSVALEGSTCPWNAQNQLILVGLQGKRPDASELPASNLVFLIDTSGSMSSSDKLELIKQSLRLLVQQLSARERVAIVTYAGSAGLVLESTPGDQKSKILNAIDRLYAGGSTAGAAGIQLAYEVAKNNFISSGNNRVILATDGDFNVGASSDAQLIRLIEEKRKDNIFLTVVGVGTGNYQEAKMEQLANKGNGNFYYLDNLNEGRKVMVTELGSTLFTIAKDVKIQIEFNPAHVKAYRLIGYENRILAKEDFNDDTVDAGELGAGHTVTALYEIVPAGSTQMAPTGSVDDLKYQKQIVYPSDDLLTIKLRYKDPDQDISKLIEKSLKRSDVFDKLKTNNFQFAAAVAEFGLLLRNSEHKANASYENALNAAIASRGEDTWGYRSEFIELIRKARTLDTRSGPAGIQFK